MIRLGVGGVSVRKAYFGRGMIGQIVLQDGALDMQCVQIEQGFRGKPEYSSNT